MPSMRWTPKQIAVLCVLAEADVLLRGVDIARQLGVNRGHVYPILHRMLACGIAVRIRQPGTVTVRYLYRLTPRGRIEAEVRVCST